jgi:hypothetical protein
MTYPMFLGLAVALALSGCSMTPQPTPRFTHIDIPGRAAPFVMFDQKTHQVCWASPDPEFGGGKGIDVIITLSEPGQTVKMPRCTDLD